MRDTAYKRKVMKAWEDRKIIGFRRLVNEESTGYLDSDEEPIWNWPECEYFIKPEPLELWVNVYGDKPGNAVFSTAAEARESVGICQAATRLVHMREVLDPDAE